jgi:hypothetical protein
MAAQFTLMSGIAPLRAAVVNGARHELLARAGLAGHEHRALRLTRHELRALG